MTAPRHRVDPRRPANPHSADPEVENYYEERLREGRTGPNLVAGLIIGVVIVVVLCVLVWLIALNWGAGK
jgi:hypothetical protein